MWSNPIDCFIVAFRLQFVVNEILSLRFARKQSHPEVKKFIEHASVMDVIQIEEQSICFCLIFSL